MVFCPHLILHTPALTRSVLDAWRVAGIWPRQAREAKALFVAGLLNEAYFLANPHRRVRKAAVPYPVPYLDQAQFGVAFEATRLRAGLGGSTGDYKQYLRPFFFFREDNGGYAVQRGASGTIERPGTTKLYLLRPEAVALLDAHWFGDSDFEVRDDTTGVALCTDDLPENGVCRTSFSTLRVPALIPFDLGYIDGLIRQERRRTDPGANFVGWRRARALSLRHLARVRQWVRVLGGVPNLYADYRGEPTDGNGRLNGVGALHLQTLPKAARRILYSGTGWWDYDFKACHWTILLALCRGHGIDAPVVEDYVEGKREIDSLLAEGLDVPGGKAKRLMLATIFGATPTLNSRSALLPILQWPGLRRLGEHLYWIWLYDTLKRVRRQLVDLHTVDGLVVNAVGKVTPRQIPGPSGKPVNVSTKTLLSHILTGVEAWAVNAVCENATDLLVVIHDGWVAATRWDARRLEQRLVHLGRERFGYSVPLRIELGQCASR